MQGTFTAHRATQCGGALLVTLVLVLFALRAVLPGLTSAPSGAPSTGGA